VSNYPSVDKVDAAEYHWQEIALDLSFWQALEKALGWNAAGHEQQTELANMGYTFLRPHSHWRR
jgi:hypothetical protein